MDELESAECTNALMESLGDRGEEYINLMNKWFRMELTRQEFEREIRKCLTNTQFRLHNQLIINILKRCIHISGTSNESKPTWNRCSSYVAETFEPIHPIFYEVTERVEVNAELPPLISHERLMPDTSTMTVRSTFAAWEHGLEGASAGVAELLSYATHQFLRNIIMAVVRKRKGCYFRNNGFIHALGKPGLNPWLGNVSGQNQDELHCLRLDSDVKGILTPRMRKSREELDRKEVFSLAASDAPTSPLAPISVNDVLYTLKLHPSLVASNFTKTVNTERMIGRTAYPCDD